MKMYYLQRPTRRSDRLEGFASANQNAVEDYPEERRAQIAAAIRRTLLPSEALANDPPAERLLQDDDLL